MTNPHRRKLLKVLSAGGATAVTVPIKWHHPVVDSVLLPAHAGTSGCIVYAVEDIPFTGDSINDQNSVCAVVCNGIGQVTQQPSYSGDSIGGVRRDGQVPVGGSTGNLIASTVGNCNPGQLSVPATLTNQTDNSIIFTLIRPNMGNYVVELPRVDTCPPFHTQECGAR